MFDCIFRINLNIRTDRPEQTVQTQTADQGLNCLLYHLHHLKVPAAQWVKRWPTDLAVLSSRPAGAMVLGKLLVPRRPTIWITVGQGATALAVGAGGSCLDIFTLICPFSPLSPSLWETARYRLKYCLKGPLNPN